MLIIVVRLSIVWILLVFVVRLMGKRQIGEMQMSEFITAFMLSELAAMPVADTGIPLLFSVVPILMLGAYEILSSYITLHSRTVQKLISGTPTILIRMGEIDQKAVKCSRITLSELMGELRQKNIADPKDVAYAILEENGKLSVIPKKAAQPPTADDLCKTYKENGICHTLISDGEISVAGLSLSGSTMQDVERMLRKTGCEGIDGVYLMTVNDAGEYRVIIKEKGGKKS